MAKGIEFTLLRSYLDNEPKMTSPGAEPLTWAIICLFMALAGNTFDLAPPPLIKLSYILAAFFFLLALVRRLLR